MSEVSTSFPDNFLWGVATSAFQIEGDRTADGSGPSVWDTFAAKAGAVEGGGTASIACDSYDHGERDLQLLDQLGVKAYRFSLGWSRICPDGETINEKALDHYERFLDALLKRGIIPLVTLNHWDMPESLMKYEGWVGRETISAFAHYSEAVAKRFGDRVTYWITQNEPWNLQLLGYELGLHAPGIADVTKAVYSGHHILLGHGAAADAIHALNPAAKVGSALSLFPCVPSTDSEADKAAAYGSDLYVNRWFLDPLLKDGYPADGVEMWNKALKVVGSDKRIDDIVLDGDEERISGRSDFLGVNYYTRRVCAAAEPTPTHPYPWAVVGPRGDVERTDESWEVCPDAFRDLLVRITQEYNAPEIVITENGAAVGNTPTHDGRVHDNRRISYIRSHLKALSQAMDAGANVTGYMHWSLMDNFEWALGYRPRFGLVYVDYRTGERILKDSALFYSNIIKTGMISDTDPQYEPFG